MKLVLVAVTRLTGPFGRRTLSVYRAPSSALFTFQPVITPFAGETTGLGLVAGSKDSCDADRRRSAYSALEVVRKGAADARRYRRGRRQAPPRRRTRSRRSGLRASWASVPFYFFFFFLHFFLAAALPYLPVPFFFFFFLHFFFFLPPVQGFSVGATLLLRGVGRAHREIGGAVVRVIPRLEQGGAAAGDPAVQRLALRNRGSVRPAGEESGSDAGGVGAPADAIDAAEPRRASRSSRPRRRAGSRPRRRS